MGVGKERVGVGKEREKEFELETNIGNQLHPLGVANGYVTCRSIVVFVCSSI